MSVETLSPASQEAKRHPKTEAQIADQVGRIASKLIDRVDAVKPLEEVKRSKGWAQKTEINNGDTTIQAKVLPGHMTEVIKVEKKTDQGTETHTANTAYDFGGYGQGTTNERVFPGAHTRSEVAGEVKDMHRGVAHEGFHKTSTGLSVFNETADGQSEAMHGPLNMVDRDSANQVIVEPPAEIKDVAISNAAETLGAIRGAVAEAEIANAAQRKAA
ncbi:MAG TPA: hypothetical protein VLE69_01300 [Candidatus Saccharimonadales bacterium]|nr:hypothetical protein [Candidatus Saccharimonadales bacterium]